MKNLIKEIQNQDPLAIAEQLTDKSYKKDDNTTSKTNQKQFKIGDIVKCLKDITFVKVSTIRDSKDNKNVITKDNLEWFNNNSENYVLVNNNKQFTQFSEELFLKYINKFSNEDKLKMLRVLFFKQNKKCPIDLADVILKYTE